MCLKRQIIPDHRNHLYAVQEIPTLSEGWIRQPLRLQQVLWVEDQESFAYHRKAFLGFLVLSLAYQ